MDPKIQLLHPSGKKAVSIDKAKYDVLKSALLECLRANGESTHANILQCITEDFRKSKIKFVGSLEWYLEWVKLDLEARKIIRRINDKPFIKFVAT
jgi:hypothetical protein